MPPFVKACLRLKILSICTYTILLFVREGFQLTVVLRKVLELCPTWVSGLEEMRVLLGGRSRKPSKLVDNGDMRPQCICVWSGAVSKVV